MAPEIEILIQTATALAGIARLEAIFASGLAASAVGEHARTLGELALRGATVAVSRESLDLLAQILGPLDRALPLSVIPEPRADGEADTASWDRHFLDPAIVELALGLGIGFREPPGNVATYNFWLYKWHERRAALAEDQLERVAAHPYFRQALVASFWPTRETRKVVGPWLDLAAQVPAFACVFEALDAYGATLLETYTMGAFEAHEPWLSALCERRVRARCPRLATALLALTAARLLRNQLRGGVMDEWVHTDAPEATKLPSDDSWLTSGGELLDEDYAHHACRVPSASGAGPLGVHDGLGGFRVTRDRGQVIGEAVDGRRFEGTVNGKYVVELMTFPAREGWYPVIDLHDRGITMPDGHTPLVPGGSLKPPYWLAPQKSVLAWYALRPRDLAASRALAVCTDAIASALVAAGEPPPSPSSTVMTIPGLQAVITAAAPPLTDSSPAVTQVISHLLPAVTDPVLIQSVAALAGAAVAIGTRIERLHRRFGDGDVPESELRNTDVPSVARLLDHEMQWWDEALGIQFGQQIFDVAHYLFRSTQTRASIPARNVFPWDQLLTRIGELLYRVLAPGTSKVRRAELVRVLELWVASGFPDHVDRLRLLELELDPAMVAGLDHAHPHLLVTWNARYSLRHLETQAGRMLVRAIALTAEPPPGATVTAEIAAAPFDRVTITATLALLAERGPIGFDPAISQRVATTTGLGVTAATLLWTAGYDPWLIGLQKRAQFGIVRSELDAAERELKPFRLRELYGTAMSRDPSDLYDAATLARRISEAFLATRRTDA